MLWRSISRCMSLTSLYWAQRKSNLSSKEYLPLLLQQNYTPVGFHGGVIITILSIAFHSQYQQPVFRYK